MCRINCFQLIWIEGKEKIVAKGEINENTVKEDGVLCCECKGCGREIEMLLKNIRCYGNFYLQFKCPHCGKQLKVDFYKENIKIQKAILKVYE